MRHSLPAGGKWTLAGSAWRLRPAVVFPSVALLAIDSATSGLPAVALTAILLPAFVTLPAIISLIAALVRHGSLYFCYVQSSGSTGVRNTPPASFPSVHRI